jgi:hypothetical protein
VAGSTVSYGGAAIGTVSGGANGSNLRIDFTSTAATVEAVEALIQHLGYRNADSSPTTSRSLALRVADGDGGTSEPSTLTVNITQSLDGTPTAHGEEQVNTTPRQPALALGGHAGRRQLRGHLAVRRQPGRQRLGHLRPALRQQRRGHRPEVRVNTLVGGDQSWAQVPPCPPAAT